MFYIVYQRGFNKVSNVSHSKSQFSILNQNLVLYGLTLPWTSVILTSSSDLALIQSEIITLNLCFSEHYEN